MSAFPNFAPGERFILEWQYRMLGGFHTALVEAICRADDGNLARLRMGFPNEVDAYLRFSREPGWWPDLQARAVIGP
jgi:hypothetical protein